MFERGLPLPLTKTKLFAGESPKDLKDVAKRYGTLFWEINKQAKEQPK